MKIQVSSLGLQILNSPALEQDEIRDFSVTAFISGYKG